MEPVTRRLFLASLAVLAGQACARRQFRALPPGPQSPEFLRDSWLSRNCHVDEDDALERAITQSGSRMVPLFEKAFRDGPPPAQLETVRRAKAERLRQTQSMIANGQNLGLPDASAKQIRALAPEQFAVKAQADFAFAYRASALAGLIVTRTPQGREIVRKEARNPDSPFRTLAEMLLSRARTKPSI